MLAYPRAVFLLTLAGLALGMVPGRAGNLPAVLDPHRYLLRSGTEPEWVEFSNRTPQGKRLEVRFNHQTNGRPATLLIRQNDVKLEWRVNLNGRPVGKLFLSEEPLWQTLEVGAGLLRNGENVLEIAPPSGGDDILVGPISLASEPFPELMSRAAVDVAVTDASSRREIPCRVTVVDNDGFLVPLSAEPGQKIAVRPGVAYLGNGRARLSLLPGNYTIWATRGPEYGLGYQSVSLAAGTTRKARLELRREVSTPGLVACDTHVHTLTHSGHGDATIEERALTLAGEAVELPIAADHDVLADYRPAANRMDVANAFTPVIGCEVTTARGHFNVFPIVPNSPVPDRQILDWPRLMQAIRATPGVRVVILNHPRNIHSNFQPFAATNFNRVTGLNLRGPEFSFDAIEVLNSSALQSDWMINFRDWMALLNYGYRVTAVGSSDCHDVSRYIVGQGRTYLRARDHDPGNIPVDEACGSLLSGRALVSSGLFTDLTVNGRFGPGDLATARGRGLEVRVRVRAPSWIAAERVTLWANGIVAREAGLSAAARVGKGTSHGQEWELRWDLPAPRHDVYLLAIASGPPVRGPYWATAKPYQPSSPVWNGAVVGATNPVWLDADGDRKFTAARGYARELVERVGVDPARLLPALAGFDESVAAQAAGLCQERGTDVRDPRFIRALDRAAGPVQRGFAAFTTALGEK